MRQSTGRWREKTGSLKGDLREGSKEEGAMGAAEYMAVLK